MPTSHTKRRRTVRILVAVVLEAGALVGWRLRYREDPPGFLRNAALLPTIPTGFEGYAWRSNDELILRYRRGKKPEFVLVNLRAGSVERLDALNKKLSAYHSRVPALSQPDGRWVMTMTKPDGFGGPYAVLDQAGNVVGTLPHGYSRPGWTPDGNRALSFSLGVSNSQVVAYDLKTHTTSTHRLSGAAFTGSFEGFIDNDTMLISQWVDNNAALLGVSLKNGSSRPLGSTPAHSRSNWNYRNMVLSPDGRRLLLYYDLSESRLWKGAEQLPWIGSWGQYDHVWLLQVYNLDGTGLREIGRFKVGQDDPWPGGFAWRPDSRHISFGYDGRLYQIAAD